MIFTCPICGKEKEIKPHDKDKVKTCSRKCQGEWFRRMWADRDHPNNKGVKIICRICGKEIPVRPCEATVQKTCGNKECVSKWRSQRMRGKNNYLYKEPTELTCPICGKKFYDRPSHAEDRVCCSRKCGAKYRSEKYSGENSWFTKEKIIKNCKWCDKEFKVKPSKEKVKGGGNFCSRECLNKWRSKFNRGENHWHWLGGISNFPYCEKFDKEFRNRVRAYFNYQCVECGTPQEICKRGLSVHHVHYDKNSCCSEDAPKLFIPLCGSCHSKTSAHKNRQELIDKYSELLTGYYQDKCFFTKEEYSLLFI